MLHDTLSGLPDDAALAQWMSGRAAAPAVPHGALLLRLLDEIDYGLLLVDGDGRVRLANRQARLECAAPAAPLRLLRDELQPRRAGDGATLRAALAAARAGRRTLLAFDALHIAVVPLDDPEGGPSQTLLVFGKRRVCEALSVEMFARAHGLTSAESKVLQALCGGAQPAGIARDFGVAVSTVRTQLASLRQKTQSASIGDVVKQVAVLPPLLSALRTQAAGVLH